jgi:hypothetical protein
MLRNEKSCWFGDIFTMPGANWSIFGCGTRRKNVGLRIFRIPSGKDELSTRTREAWLNVIKKDRVVDKSLRRQIDTGELYVCKKNFKTEEIDCRKCILILLP